MAKILLGTNIAGISGKQGGTVYAKNRFGFYMRNKGSIVNTATAKQSAVRTNFRDSASRWKELTEAERNSWNVFASNYTYINPLGESKKLTGAQLFTGGQARQKYLGLILSDSPGVSVPPTSPAINITGFEIQDDGILIKTVGAAAWDVPAGFTVVINATHPLAASNGYTTAKKFVRYVTQFLTADTITDEQSIGAEYELVPYPFPQTHELVWFRVDIVHNLSGIISNTQTFSAVRA